MKILQLCSRVPFPPNNGGSIAMLALTRCLKASGNELTVLCINTPKHYFDIATLPSELQTLAHWEAKEIDTSIKPFNAFLNLFTGKSYHIQRFHSKDYEKALINLLEKESFDVIQIESLFVTPYIAVIRRYSKAKVVYRAHNIEHKIWERMIEGMKPSLERIYLKLQTKRLKNFEIKIIQQLDAIVTITPEDKKYFSDLGFKNPIHIAPIGVQLEDFNLPEHHNKYPVLFHLGSMNWLPNREAMDWFINEVWMTVHKKYLALKLYLGGRGMPDHLMKSNVPSLYVQDEILDGLHWMNAKDIMIVPLLSGSGMRVKIIEGMALGKTIISTTIGAEGIDYTHLENILIADTPQDFVKMIDLCLSDYEYCKSIGRNAKELVKNKYSNHKIGEELNDFYAHLVTDLNPIK